MNCPNCNKLIKDKNALYCPKCGEPLISDNIYRNLNEDNIEILIRRNRSNEDKNTGNIFIFLGIFFFLIIFGIFLLSAGILIKKEAKKNAKNNHEIMYLDKQNNKIIIYSIDNKEYVVDPKDIVNLYESGTSKEIEATLIYKDKSKGLILGFTFKDDLAKAKTALKEINK